MVNQHPVVGPAGETVVIGVMSSDPLGDILAGSDVIAIYRGRINDVEIMHRLGFIKKRAPAVWRVMWELLGSNQ